MPAPFAALEARLNEAVFRRLSDTEGTVGGVAVAGIFDDEYAVGDVGGVGMSSSQPMFLVPSAGLTGELVGQVVVVYQADGVTVRGQYTVAESRPDGRGSVELWLEDAA